MTVVAEATHRQRSRKRKRVKKYLILRDGFTCHYCCCGLVESDYVRKNTATIEHVVPRLMGGTNASHNLVLACNDCNNKMDCKTDKCACNFCQQAWALYNGTSTVECFCTGCLHIK